MNYKDQISGLSWLKIISSQSFIVHDVRMVVAKHQRVVQLYHFHTSFGNISLGHDVNQDGHYKDGNAILFF